jgi:hypothetical protein
MCTAGGVASAQVSAAKQPTLVTSLGPDSSFVPDSPGTHATGVEYSPQTVLVPAATVASSLRSVSPDGTTYTFSPATAPLSKLKQGSVMFLQGTAVRLVTGVAPGPAGLVVHTVAAPLTDLITNGSLSWDTPVNFADAYAIQGPGVPADGAKAPSLVSGAPDSTGPALSASLAQRFRLSPLASGSVTLSGKTSTYDYSIEFKQAGTAVSVTITLSKSSPVDVSASVTGTLDNFNTEGAITVNKGHLGSAKVAMDGLKGQFTLAYELKPVSAFGLGSSGGIKLTLPGELTLPFYIGGIPFFLGIKTAFFVSVGFSNKNQSIEGSYTVNYDGNAGFTTSSTGVSDAAGAITGIGKVLLDQANAILSGPISLVLGAQIPQLELGLGVKGLNVAGYVDLVADTALQVGGNSGGIGAGTGGCDARDLKVVASAGAEANFFGFSATTGSSTLFSQDFLASYPPGCGTVGG